MPKMPKIAKEAEQVNAAELDRPDPAQRQVSCPAGLKLHVHKPTQSTEAERGCAEEQALQCIASI